MWPPPLHRVATPTQLEHPAPRRLPVGRPRRLVAPPALTERAVAVLVGLPALAVGLALGLLLLFAVASLIV